MNILIQYAMQFVAEPYRWGGDDPVNGFDCSGLIQELLASVGLDPPGDQTAQSLFDYFDLNGERNPKPGAGVICFYGESVAKITHVALMLDAYRIIEAGGGGSKTTSLQAAADQNAFVRIRHLSNRKPVAMRKPRYATIGLI